MRVNDGSVPEAIIENREEWTFTFLDRPETSTVNAKGIEPTFPLRHPALQVPAWRPY